MNEVQFGDGAQVYDHDRESVRWTRIDDNAEADAIAWLGACGNWADCMFAVLVACPGGTGYEAVWGPEYAQHVDVSRTGDPGWGILELVNRRGEPGCDWPERVSYERVDGAWQEIGRCADGVREEAWREDCGPLPEPSCPELP